jgi:hypothetical protein
MISHGGAISGKTTGILLVFCEITKSGITDRVKPHVTAMHQLLKLIESNTRLLSNTVVRKLRIKLKGRLAVGVLPSRRHAISRRGPLLPNS